MWSLIRANISEIVTIGLAILGAVKVRRIWAWFGAAKEAQTYRAMFENEQTTKTYWQAETAACRAELDHIRHALSEISAASKTD